MTTVSTWTISFLILVAMVGVAHSAHFSYTPDDKSHPCIMMDAKFSFKINAVRYTRVIASNIHNSEDETVTITGSCGPTTAILNMGFSGSVMWSFIFGTSDADVGKVKLSRLIQFVPKNIFAPYATNVSDSLTFDDPNTIYISYTNESYLCTTKRRTQYFPIKTVPRLTTFSIETTIHSIRAQAFGLNRGRYSPSVLCHDDIANATTHSTTTTTATTTTTELTPTSAPDNTFYVPNAQNTTVCIVLEGRIDVSIRYDYNTTDGESGTRTGSFPIPKNATWHGSCHSEDGTQNLVIEFFEPSWSLTFTFKEKHHTNSTSDGLLDQTQGKLDYSIDKIDVTYVIDSERFPDSVLHDGDVVHETSKREGYPHKSLGKDYYSCSAENEMMLDKKVSLVTWGFKFKAFNENKDRTFGGSVSKCYADENHNAERAAIIVGSVVGGIFLIILIIIIITICSRRRRRRRHYNIIKGRM